MVDMRSQNKGLLEVLRGPKGWLAGWLLVLMVEEGYMADMRSQNKGLLAILRGQKCWLASC